MDPETKVFHRTESDSEDFVILDWVVLTQYSHVTNTEMDRWTPLL